MAPKREGGCARRQRSPARPSHTRKWPWRLLTCEDSSTNRFKLYKTLLRSWTGGKAVRGGGWSVSKPQLEATLLHRWNKTEVPWSNRSRNNSLRFKAQLMRGSRAPLSQWAVLLFTANTKCVVSLGSDREGLGLWQRKLLPRPFLIQNHVNWGV